MRRTKFAIFLNRNAFEVTLLCCWPMGLWIACAILNWKWS